MLLKSYHTEAEAAKLAHGALTTLRIARLSGKITPAAKAGRFVLYEPSQLETIRRILKNMPTIVV